VHPTKDVALPAGLLTTISSWDRWAREEGARLKWDAVVSFKVPLTDEKVAEVMADKGVAKWDGCVNSYAPVRRADGVTEEMRIRGLPADSEMVRGSAHLTGGRWFTNDDAAEAIVNTGFAGARAARVGEEITVIRKGVSHRLVVVGLLSDAAHASMAVPRRTAQRIFGLEGKSSAAYLRYGALPPPRPVARPQEAPAKPVSSTSNAEILEKIDLDEATAQALPVAPPPPVRVVTDTKSALLDNELVTTVEVRTAFVGATLAYLSSFNVIIVPFVGLSGILSFFFLVSVLGFLLIERETEYATLRSMGYATSEIARIVLVEVGVLAAVGLVLSLGTWALTAYALREPMTKTWFLIPLDFRARDFAVASVPTLLFLVFAALPGIRALMRMDLSSALRGRGLG
jgi:ABC-type antimicrobial peptide transport system permease subunit